MPRPIAQSAPFVGTERFRLEARLGEGGMGVVYRVFDRERGAHVALKTLAHVDAAGIYRFKEEFRALADLAHPNVVQLHELVGHGGSWFFTMELIDGVSFVDWVNGPSPSLAPSSPSARPISSARRVSAAMATVAGPPPSRPASGLDVTIDASRGLPRPPLPVPDVERLREALRQLAEGVAAIHAAGKLHRDVKPSNVMVTRAGRVVLLDFGLVGDFDPGEAPRAEAHLLGTPAYMAPEQAGARVATPASDWYAVGTILYECLTGRLPFEGGAVEMMVGKQRSYARAPSSLVSGVPEDLESLCVELLRVRPEERPSGDEVLSRITAGRARSGRFPIVSRAPFVGRTAELAAIDGARADVVRGTARAVLVRGRSGMGKSALVATFLERARRSGDLVLSGRCYERESVPFKAFDAVVDSLARHLAALDESTLSAVLPDGAQDVARVFPVLRSVPSLEFPTSAPKGDAHEQRRRAFTALRRLFAAFARRRTVIVHVDDLQWGDSDSAELLAELLAPPGAPAILLLGTVRSGVAEGPLIEALAASEAGRELLASATEIEVGELSDDEAMDLARRLGGELVDAHPELPRAIAREAGGSPLFVAELVRYEEARAERGELASDRRSPTSLDEAILGRVAELPDDARRLLETLAVAGRPIERPVALSAAGLDDLDPSCVRVLRGAKMVNTRGLAESDGVETFHDRIREAVVSSLDAWRLREIHTALAAALTASGRADPEAILEHVLGAGDRHAARALAIRSAELAGHNLAFRRAARLYRVAISLGAAGDDHRLHQRLGDALANAGLGADAAGAYLEAAQRANRPARAVDLRRLAAEHLMKSGRDDEGVAVLRDVLGQVGLSYPASPRAAIVSILLNRTRLRFSGLKFEERPEIDVAREDLSRTDVAYSAAVGLSMQDTLRGADFASRSLVLALRAGEPVRLCRALALEASMTASAGLSAKKRAQELVAVAESLSYRLGDPHVVAFARLAGAYVSVLCGDWLEAQHRFAEVEDVLRDRCHGVAWEMANTQLWLMNALILSGQLASARTRVRGVVREAMERGDRFTMMHMVYPVTVGHIVGGEVDQARRFVSELLSGWTIERYTAGHWGAYVSSLSLDRYVGDGRSAWERTLREFPAIEASYLFRVQMVRVFAGFERGMAAVAGAVSGFDVSSALTQADRTARSIRKETPYGAAMGALVSGMAAACRGRQDDAVSALRNATQGLEATGMRYLAACARERLGQMLGGDEGAALRAATAAYFREQGVVSPESCVRMTAPARE